MCKFDCGGFCDPDCSESGISLSDAYPSFGGVCTENKDGRYQWSCDDCGKVFHSDNDGGMEGLALCDSCLNHDDAWKNRRKILQQGYHTSFEAVYGRKPIAGEDYDADKSMCQDEYEFYTGAGRYLTTALPDEPHSRYGYIDGQLVRAEDIAD